MPHPSTLSRFYAHTSANPGFTNEALKILNFNSKNVDHPIVG